MVWTGVVFGAVNFKTDLTNATRGAFNKHQGWTRIKQKNKK